jgi:fibronectin type 3 domain-containing protein
MKYMNKYYIIILIIALLPVVSPISAQEIEMPEAAQPQENVRAKGFVTEKKEIKLRWAPATPKAWLDGKKYGYKIERYTVMIDRRWQEKPEKTEAVESLKQRPLTEWEEYVQKSDYAAVIAQAFYGEDFELSQTTNANDVQSIINQANELEQRFATSTFMAEYDYKAAKLAGWAWTDTLTRENERYLYRIYLNRPERQVGDTAAVYIGTEDRKELPKPIGLIPLFGNRAVILSWNYALLQDTYHSYHVERKSETEPFRRITELPVTPLNAEMKEMFYTDSLPNNDTVYTYRITGLNSFDETSPYSDEVSGQGKKPLSCIPYIYSGDFTEKKDIAKIYWKFQCDEPDMISKFSLRSAKEIDGDYQTLIDSIPAAKRDLEFTFTETKGYVKLQAFDKKGNKTESFPFQLRAIDSIPPAIPTGLKVAIDTLGVAHLSWDANKEPDLRGYRILRGFTDKEEKSSITPEFITQNEYADSLSLTLSNSHVYYALTALDERYNESLPCKTVKAAKPNKATPAQPVITGYKVEGSKVTVEWITDPSRPDITYSLERTNTDKPEDTKVVFSKDFHTTVYTDNVPAAGSYRYNVVAAAASGKKSSSPQPLELDITIDDIPEGVSGFTSYTDADRGYIELSWKKQEKASLYRIYKAEDKGNASLWQELAPTQNRITDERVARGTVYTYTILYITAEGRPSKAKTITVNY